MKQTMTLSDDQQQAINKLKRLRVGALFMEPGTGKTLTAFQLIESSDSDFVLFLVPFQTKGNLQDEIDKWHFDKPYLIVGIESLSNSDRLYIELLETLKTKNRAFCVVDESLKIKNKDSIRTMRILELGKLCYYRLILNGTPLSKNILDIWSQMEFLSPKILKMNYAQFKNTFVEYVQFKKGRNRKEQIKKFVNMEYLYSLIEPYVFEAELDLMVSQQYIEVYYDIYNKLPYEQARNTFLNTFSDMSTDIEFLSHAQMMQQSYCNDVGKIDALKEILKQTDAPCIIFCKYIRSVEAIKDYIRDEDLILTYGKGALGLNLQKYKNMIFFDKTWDYAQLEQAKRRIYRTGQTEDVKFYMMTGNVGLENMMNQSIDKKINILDMFKQASKGELENAI